MPPQVTELLTSELSRCQQELDACDEVIQALRTKRLARHAPPEPVDLTVRTRSFPSHSQPACSLLPPQARSFNAVPEKEFPQQLFPQQRAAACSSSGIRTAISSSSSPSMPSDWLPVCRPLSPPKIETLRPVVEDEGAEHRAHVQREMELKSAKARAVALEAQNKELQEQLERKQEEFEQLTASAATAAATT